MEKRKFKGGAQKEREKRQKIMQEAAKNTHKLTNMFASTFTSTSTSTNDGNIMYPIGTDITETSGDTFSFSFPPAQLGNGYPKKQNFSVLVRKLESQQCKIMKIFFKNILVNQLLMP